MTADVVSASTEFNIFSTRPVQISTLETTENLCKPIASLDQSDLEFLIPENHDTYIDLNIQLFIRGKLMKTDGTDLDEKSTRSWLTSYYNNPCCGPLSLSRMSQDDTDLRS